MEDEKHFLLKCNQYNGLRLKHGIIHLNEASAFFNDNNLYTVGNFLYDAFNLREEIVKTNKGTIEGGGLGKTLVRTINNIDNYFHIFIYT